MTYTSAQVLTLRVMLALTLLLLLVLTLLLESRLIFDS